jgi:hypothetical protein
LGATNAIAKPSPHARPASAALAVWAGERGTTTGHHGTGFQRSAAQRALIPGESPQAGINRAVGPKLIAMAQSLSLVVIHVIFSTKERRPLIDADTRLKLHAYLATLARNATPGKLLLHHGADPNLSGGENVDAFIGIVF